MRKLKHEIIPMAWEERDFNDPALKEFWEVEWEVGLGLQDSASDSLSKRINFLNWCKEAYDYLNQDLKDGYIKNDKLDELMLIIANN